MGKIVKEAHRFFKDETQAECVFGSRINPASYWEARVNLLQRLQDKASREWCYLVDDTERCVVGIGVLNTHKGCKGLLVQSADMLAYTDDAGRQQCLTLLKTKLQ